MLPSVMGSQLVFLSKGVEAQGIVRYIGPYVGRIIIQGDHWDVGLDVKEGAPDANPMYRYL